MFFLELVKNLCSCCPLWGLIWTYLSVSQNWFANCFLLYFWLILYPRILGGLMVNRFLNNRRQIFLRNRKIIKLSFCMLFQRWIFNTLKVLNQTTVNVIINYLFLLWWNFVKIVTFVPQNWWRSILSSHFFIQRRYKLLMWKSLSRTHWSSFTSN